MRQFAVALLAVLLTACASGSKQEPPKEVSLKMDVEIPFDSNPLNIVDCDYQPELCAAVEAGAPLKADDLPFVLTPEPEQRAERPAGDYLQRVGKRATHIRERQKTWREMGSTDKPLVVKTPTQVVTSTIAPTKTAPVKIAPTGKKNIDSLINYVIGSVAVLLLGALVTWIKRMKK